MKILTNARAINVSQPSKVDSVVVVDHGRIIAIGGDEIVGRFQKNIETHDMGGRFVLPGFTDAHIHLHHYALSLHKVNVETKTKSDAIKKVAEKISTLKPGEWVLGHGWQQNDWDGKFPTREELDVVSPNNPVYLTGKSLHISWANTVALEMIGIGQGSQDPENGKILRDEHGIPTGILLETAMNLVEDKLPKLDEYKIADLIELAIPSLWKYGITAVHDFDYRPAFKALQILDIAGKLKLRVVKNIPVDLLGFAADLGLRTGFGSEFLKIGAIKVFMDGALGPRTAAMVDPYADDDKNRGILNMDGEEFYELAVRAADSGLAMTGHAIGDRAIHEILLGYDRLRQYEQRNGLSKLRHRIEHVQVIHPEDQKKLAELDIIASMQPIHAASDMLAADKYWGERARLSYAWKTQLNSGAVLAFGSDSPVESPNPFWGLYVACTRKKLEGRSENRWYGEQCISIEEAIKAYTIGPAFTSYQENVQGKLDVGYYADMIVLDNNPYTCSEDELKNMTPSATMVAGDWVWGM